MNMKISPLNTLNIFPSSKISPNISFGTCARLYRNECLDTFVGDITLTNTWMLRDDIEWKNFASYLGTHFKDKPKVNILSVASSDGSEAYTTAISLLEELGEAKAQKFFPIQGSDRDQEVLEAAKSGYLKMGHNDTTRLKDKVGDYAKYFKITPKKLNIQNDDINNKTVAFKVDSSLRKCVTFEKSDIKQKLTEIKDDSNTVVMCRNVLPYMNSFDVLGTAMIVSKKLKKGSLFVIGDYDAKNTDIRNYLENLGFVPVMKNVYKKMK